MGVLRSQKTHMIAPPCQANSLRVADVGDGWFAATEKSDYIQAIGLSSAKFQHYATSTVA